MLTSETEHIFHSVSTSRSTGPRTPSTTYLPRDLALHADGALRAHLTQSTPHKLQPRLMCAACSLCTSHVTYPLNSVYTFHTMYASRMSVSHTKDMSSTLCTPLTPSPPHTHSTSCATYPSDSMHPSHMYTPHMLRTPHLQNPPHTPCLHHTCVSHSLLLFYVRYIHTLVPG